MKNGRIKNLFPVRSRDQPINPDPKTSNIIKNEPMQPDATETPKANTSDAIVVISSSDASPLDVPSKKKTHPTRKKKKAYPVKKRGRRRRKKPTIPDTSDAEVSAHEPQHSTPQSDQKREARHEDLAAINEEREIRWQLTLERLHQLKMSRKYAAAMSTDDADWNFERDTRFAMACLLPWTRELLNAKHRPTLDSFGSFKWLNTRFPGDNMCLVFKRDLSDRTLAIRLKVGCVWVVDKGLAGRRVAYENDNNSKGRWKMLADLLMLRPGMLKRDARLNTPQTFTLPLQPTTAATPTRDGNP